MVENLFEISNYVGEVTDFEADMMNFLESRCAAYLHIIQMQSKIGIHVESTISS